VEQSARVEIANGLLFPEGPVALPDGSLLVAEIEGRRLSRIGSDGGRETVACLGGGPNGVAIGPDGRAFVCNNGGMGFTRQGDRVLPGLASADYRGGWIDAVDLRTGAVQRLYERCGDIPLRAPNDLVFDAHGGFWFTDMGKSFKGALQRDRGAVYYATADGTSIRRAIFPMEGPNGIGLSRDGRILYVAESTTGRLWSFDVGAPGEILRQQGGVPWERGHLLWAANYYCILDSLAVDASGNVCVADIPNGGITVVSSEGRVLERHPMPDLFTTNICFGGPGLRTAYVTLSGTGRLVSVPWPRGGLPLNWLDAAPRGTGACSLRGSQG
jgi:gluconolactonase